MPYHCSLRAWEIRQQKDTCRWYLPFSCKTSCMGAFTSMLSARLSIRILLQVMIIKTLEVFFSRIKANAEWQKAWMCEIKKNEDWYLALNAVSSGEDKLHKSNMWTLLDAENLYVSVLQTIAIVNVVSQTTATLLPIWPMALMQLGTDLLAWDWIGAIQVFNYMLLSYSTIQELVLFHKQKASTSILAGFKKSNQNLPPFHLLPCP